MKKLHIVAASLVLIVVLGFTFKTPAPAVWEYKFSDTCSEKRANELGAQGWELVGVDSAGSYPVKMSTCIFKRTKQ